MGRIGVTFFNPGILPKSPSSTDPALHSIDPHGTYYRKGIERVKYYVWGQARTYSRIHANIADNLP